MDVVLVKNANRMMTTASLLDGGIELSFADGHRGLIPYDEVPRSRESRGHHRPGVAQPLRDGPANVWAVKMLKFPGTSPGIIATQPTGPPSKPLRHWGGRPSARGSAGTGSLLA